MDLLRFLPFILLFSCAKFSYIVEQGIGQVSLEWNGRSNQKVLNDPKISKSHKEKIKAIKKYKDYFYEYFNMESTSIYNATTFLENKAVTYLVIASPKDRVEPIKVSFPIVGEFPYLGFFDKESAQVYKKEKDSEGYSTYLRPVYAYSTLNQWIFKDNILSSFFILKEKELSKLIFHELVHTVFFIKNEVQLNESLAEYISEKLNNSYYKVSKEDLAFRNIKQERYTKIRKLIVSKVQELNLLYKEGNNPGVTLENFLNQNFKPSVKALCEKVDLKKCWPNEIKWNNARFSAYLTYKENESLFEQLALKNNLDSKELLAYLKKEYDNFEDSDIDTFKNYLKRQLN